MQKKTWLACIILLSLVNIFLFWPGKLYFLNDDLLHIPLTDAGEIFQTNSVRPLHELLVKIDLLIWNKNAYGYHITALLLHFIVCLQLFDLTYILQKRLLKSESSIAIQASLLAVILFLLYPQHSESLAWIVGRGPVLSAIFLLIAFRLFFVERFTSTIYIVGALCFAASLFTYEQGFLLPLILLQFYFSKTVEFRKQQMLTYSYIMIGVCIAYIAARLYITSEIVGNYEGANFKSLNIVTLAANAVRLILRMFINPGSQLAFLIAAVVFTLLSLALLPFRKDIKANKSVILIFSVIILCLLVPIVSLGIPVTSFESGRFLYIPSIFLVAGLSIAGVSIYNQNIHFRRGLISLLLILSCYWISGKYKASKDYKEASSYALSVQNKVQQHFAATSDTLYIDTLYGSIQRLPVYRLGFKTGVKWLNNNVDTNKILVKHYQDEVGLKNNSF
jgi:hypothetical protein